MSKVLIQGTNAWFLAVLTASLSLSQSFTTVSSYHRRKTFSSMVPYALTPTMERGELPEGGWSTSLPNISRSSGTSSPSTNSDQYININSPAHANSSNHQTVPSDSTDSPTGRSTNGASSPKPVAFYEDAFVHGYKEGFAKAHIELKHL
jgi:hypothetical protein